MIAQLDKNDLILCRPIALPTPIKPMTHPFFDPKKSAPRNLPKSTKDLGDSKKVDRKPS